MRAVILAAGRGRRLRSPLPKCLQEVGGSTLLARQVTYLTELGVEVAVVVGYEQHRVQAGVEAPVTWLVNPRYAEGNALSVACASAWLTAGDSLLMDADLLYPRSFLEKLLARPGNCLLVDPRLQDTGEEVKVYAQGERVVGLSKQGHPELDPFGESVGIFRLERAAGVRLCQALTVSDPAEEYEPVLDRILNEIELGFETVSEPWIEIDFPEDLEQARQLVL